MTDGTLRLDRHGVPIAARSSHGYGAYGYDYDNPGYSTSDYTSANGYGYGAYGYDRGFALGGAYLPTRRRRDSTAWTD